MVLKRNAFPVARSTSHRQHTGVYSTVYKNTCLGVQGSAHKRMVSNGYLRTGRRSWKKSFYKNGIGTIWVIWSYVHGAKRSSQNATRGLKVADIYLVCTRCSVPSRQTPRWVHSSLKPDHWPWWWLRCPSVSRRQNRPAPRWWWCHFVWRTTQKGNSFIGLILAEGAKADCCGDQITFWHRHQANM